VSLTGVNETIEDSSLRWEDDVEDDKEDDEEGGEEDDEDGKKIIREIYKIDCVLSCK
jgi:hypothetical protein